MSEDVKLGHDGNVPLFMSVLKQNWSGSPFSRKILQF